MHATELHERIATAPNLAAIDGFRKAIWLGWGDGHYDDAQAMSLSAAADARAAATNERIAAKSARRGGWSMSGFKPLQTAPRAARRPPLQRPEQVERRRKQAASGALPPDVAKHFTIAQNAALSVVAHQVRRNGRCTLPLDRIANLAGVCRRTVKVALRLAAQLGLISITERRVCAWRSLPHLLMVKCADWLKWLRRPGPVASIDKPADSLSQGGKNVSTTITQDKNTKINRPKPPPSPWQSPQRGRREGAGWHDTVAFPSMQGQAAWL